MGRSTDLAEGDGVADRIKRLPGRFLSQDTGGDDGSQAPSPQGVKNRLRSMKDKASRKQVSPEADAPGAIGGAEPMPQPQPEPEPEPEGPEPALPRPSFNATAMFQDEPEPLQEVEVVTSALVDDEADPADGQGQDGDLEAGGAAGADADSSAPPQEEQSETTDNPLHPEGAHTHQPRPEYQQHQPQADDI